MFDIWGFLLQTLTASGVAILILIIKELFRDKLPPRWHFLVWSVLGIILIIPVGFNGRYTLFHWRFIIELMKSLFKDYSFVRVLFPFPIINAIPHSVIDWIFIIYVIGVIVHLIKYLVSYIGLRKALRIGATPSEELLNRIRMLAEEQNIKLNRIIEVEGIPSAFVYGVFHPVLVLPSGEILDDKVLIHELFHLKNRDTLWNIIICILRSIHWCNPLLNYCANRAINDMESRCDQYVLESIKGEECREYGHILLSMTNEKYADTPGSTSINNGGNNIRDRIEAIARFKKYPKGMELVSICVWIVLTFSLVGGVQASSIYKPYKAIDTGLAFARSVSCTTAAGAIDSYAKSVLDQNGYYRAMCAPETDQQHISDILNERQDNNIYPEWDNGIKEWPKTENGYYIYNYRECDNNTFEGLFVIELGYPPNGKTGEDGKMYLAVQNIRVKKENGRWVVETLEEFRNVEADIQSLDWGCQELPGYLYVGTSDEFRAEVKYQTVHCIDSSVKTSSDFFFGNTYTFDTTPKPHTEFSSVSEVSMSRLIHLGKEEEREKFEDIGFFVSDENVRKLKSKDMPQMYMATNDSTSDSGNWNRFLYTDTKFGPVIEINGGGGSQSPEQEAEYPEYYNSYITINQKMVGQMKLYPQEEVTE